MLREEALEYHQREPRGKISISVTKPFATQHDLAMAYSPGVAAPVLEIARDPDAAFLYTIKGNLVAVVTNGTAVLGLGNVGALAGKPVMEGKAVLFKRFADVDVFDIEVDASDPDEFVRVVKALEPTFGGINLEDIKGPDCFLIEERLKAVMDIPVFHDDQHGTAIISGAALLNALDVVGKKPDEVRVVVAGAGAAGLSCAKFFKILGIGTASMVLTDIDGVLRRGREAPINPWAEPFAVDTEATTLAEVMVDADVLVGLAAGGIVTSAMVKSMAERPIVFALSNPDPEIGYHETLAARPDAVVATGRSDFPNQVNNVLGFPYIFRGALDVRARAISDEMKVAACMALKDLAREEVPQAVLRAYGLDSLQFGRDYLIPTPLDPRVPLRVTPAVAEAAMASGVARITVDMGEYRDRLARRFLPGRQAMAFSIARARSDPKRIAYAEGEDLRVMRAAQTVAADGIGRPVLLGRSEVISAGLHGMDVPDGEIEVVDPITWPEHNEYVALLYEDRKRKGVTQRDASAMMTVPAYLAAMMVRTGRADAMVAGIRSRYADVIRPALQVIGPAPGITRVATMHLVLVSGHPYVLADTMVNVDPTAEEVADIAVMASERARQLEIVPHVALLSFSNFGSTRHPRSDKMAEATKLIRARRPDLEVDGEMMVDFALHSDQRHAEYPFSHLDGDANVLIFPGLESANMSYKLLGHAAGATVIGPILMGMARPVHVLSSGADVADIVNISAIAVVDAQSAPRLQSA